MGGSCRARRRRQSRERAGLALLPVGNKAKEFVCDSAVDAVFAG
jgi:hypothetical protein